ncbi:MAG: septum formation initiator family protein [Candidatus Omnitrophota bacterium]|nr:septum formation initiator family protein [Candidatus Omnitrophota bacterium]
MEKKSLIKISVFTLILLAIFLPPFIRYQQLCWKSKSLDNQVKALRVETKKLEAEKLRLQTDITYVERRAREKIGVVKKGEIILKETPAKK